MIDSKRLGKVLVAILLLVMLTFTAVGMSVAAQDEPTDEELELAGLALGGMCCMIVLIPFIIGLVIAIWVYKDAKKRNMSGGLWLIIVILFSLLGLIIYLIVRRGHPEQPAMPPPGQYPPQQPGYPPQQPPPQ